MKQIINLIIIFILVNHPVDAQGLFGGTTRAVVVGVSEYQDDGIQDLHFAHKDAEAFVDFLRSSAGGSVPIENITLLVNEKATRASVLGALDWLLVNSKKGDKAIIYFSGHGDTETRTNKKFGYFLAYDSKTTVYQANACQIDYVKTVIETLSDKQVKVIMISDACRAGKAEGPSLNGAQAATSVLQERFGNEIKILSCQPNQVSHEGEKWGNGRGVFSYYLLEGLYGEADENNDGAVNLMEIRRYLEGKLPYETSPQQIPLTNGDNIEILAMVDPERENENIPAISAAESNIENSSVTSTRGIHNEVNDPGQGRGAEQNEKDSLNSDSVRIIYVDAGEIPSDQSNPDEPPVLAYQPIVDPVREDILTEAVAPPYDERAARKSMGGMEAIGDDLDELTDTQWEYLIKLDYAIQNGNLIDPVGRAAFDHWKKLQGSGVSDKIIETEKRRLIIALQEEVQQVINSYLDARFFFASDIEESIRKAESYSRYLEVEAELIGENDYFFNTTKAESFYFLALRDRLKVNLETWSADSLITTALGNCKRALELDPYLAIAHNEVGVLYAMSGDLENAEVKFKDALIYAPSWLIPLSNLNKTFVYTGQLERSEELMAQIEEMGSDNPWIWFDLGQTYTELKRYDEAVNMYQKALDILPGYIDALNGMGVVYQYGKYNIQLAEKYYLEALQIDPGSYYPSVNLATLYYNGQSYNRAEEVIKSALQKYQFGVYLHQILGNVYIAQNRLEEAFEEYQIMVEEDPFYTDGYVSLSYYYALKGDVNNAIANLESAFIFGYQNFEYIESNTTFQEVINTPQYHELKVTYDMR